MDNCKWKDREFRSCDGLYSFKDTIKIAWKHCPYCGADIRKPELEKPLIVKSGGTFVTEHEEINYFWTEQESPEDIGSIDYDGKWKVHCGWKSFSEIEKEGLTDEIAKLRPIVTTDGNDQDILYGVRENVAIYTYGCDRIADIRLATPHELQEAK